MFEELERAARQLGCALERDLPLSSHTTFRIGGPAALAITPADPGTLPPLLRLCRERQIPWMVLGNGSNLLARDGGYGGVLFRLREGSPEFEGNTVTCPAGTPLKTLCRAARDRGLSGLEFAYGIPGTVGGALFMNAGAYGGEMKDRVTGALAADEGGIRLVPVEEMGLAYRRSAFMDRRDQVILSVAFTLVPDDPEAIAARMEELIRRRREKQPLEYPSAGSFFKRPPGHFAGALIEQAGLKGCAVGGAQVSQKHAGFLINRGGATAADFLRLMAQVQDTVEARFGVRLEPEVRIVGSEG